MFRNELFRLLRTRVWIRVRVMVRSLVRRQGRRGEAGERRPEERRGSRGKWREEGEEEERIGSICQSPAGSCPSASWRNSEERDKKPVATQEAGSSHQGPEASLCEGSGSWLPQSWAA